MAGISLARNGIREARHLASPSGVWSALALGMRTSEVVADVLLTHTPTPPSADTGATSAWCGPSRFRWPT